MKICANCGIEKELNHFAIRTDSKKHRNKCKICEKVYRKEYYLTNKENHLQRIRQYSNDHKIEKALYDNNRRQTLPKSYRKDINKRYWENLKYDSVRKEKYYKNCRKYRKENKQAILSHRLRERIRKLLKSNSMLKSNKSIELLGANLKDVLGHIESKFKAGMSWQNKDQFIFFLYFLSLIIYASY